ncbi:MAG TPA: hypothetical protein VNM71_05875 [Steroidobacteraceae bacterium]|jgi:hypothetical protein|nr:hypothetical protein [Steroidobacteraceae bacterium]
MKLKLLAAAALAIPMLLAGCVTSEVKPIPKVAAKQATVHIPEAELLDVGIRVFDPGIPKNIENDDEALAKKRIYPDLRKAEARYMPTLLRATLEETAQWGAVRVIPATADFVDVIVTGKVVDSNGGFMAVDITAVDAAGRVWLKDKRYSSLVDLGAYKTTAALKARDPFQNVYSEIANDMVVIRDKLSALDRENIRKIASLRFAQDLAPDAMAGMTAVDKNGITQVARLPAEGDPTLGRIERIRERDTAVVDTVNDYYASFAESIDDSYDSWRQTSFTELEKEMRAKSSARTRTVLGAAALIASIFAPNSCSTYDACRINDAMRTAGTMGGIAAVLSGIKKYADARTHADALKELTLSFQAEVSPQVVEVEGHTLRLTGTAEDQYREWRKLLKQLYLEETGAAAAAAPAAPAPPATTTATSNVQPPSS